MRTFLLQTLYTDVVEHKSFVSTWQKKINRTWFEACVKNFAIFTFEVFGFSFCVEPDSSFEFKMKAMGIYVQSEFYLIFQRC